MPRVIITPRADRDIVAILDYLTQNAGARVAGKYADAIDEAIARLAHMPGTAAPRPSLVPTSESPSLGRISLSMSTSAGTTRFTSCASFTADATSQPTF